MSSHHRSAITPQNPPGGRSDTDISISSMPDLQEPSVDHFRSKEIFDKLEALLEEDGAAMVAKVKGVYLFRVKAGKDGAEGAWILDAKNGTGAVEFNGKGVFDVRMPTVSKVHSLNRLMYV